MGLPKKYVDYKKSAIVVQLFPYEGTVSYTTGTSKGPRAIIDASRFIEDFDVYSKKSFKALGIHTSAPLNPSKKYSKPEPYIEKVYQQTLKCVKDKKFIISLGGEHSVSSGIIKAFHEFTPKLSVLHIDAHGDLRDSYEGTNYSHASALRRVSDLVKTVHVGMRTLSQDQWDYVKKNKIKMFFAHELHEKPTKDWVNEVVTSLNKNVYISIDTDGLDPSIIPATGTPEPGGLEYIELIELLREVAKRKNVVGLDIMELAPKEDFVYSEFTCARIAYQMIAFKYGRKDRK